MPRVTQAHADARREQILAAACACFARRGIHATTMTDICREAELSIGAVYGYFDGKEAIVRGAADAAGERLDLLLAETRDASPACDGLGRLLEALAACADDRTDESVRAARLEIGLWAGALSSPYLRGLLDRFYDKVIPAIAELIARQRDEERLPGGPPPDATARILVGAIQGAQLQRAMRDEAPVALARVLLDWASAAPRVEPAL